MLAPLLAATLTATPVIANEPPIPDDLKSISEARFSKELRPTLQMLDKAQRMVERGNCSSQDVNPEWDAVKVVALLLVDTNGEVRKVTPVSIGCPMVEEFGAKQIVKHLKHLTSRPGGNPQWYRTDIIFHW